MNTRGNGSGSVRDNHPQHQTSVEVFVSWSVRRSSKGQYIEVQAAIAKVRNSKA